MADNYQDMKVDELREMAAQRDISGRSEMNKEDLVRALENYEPQRIQAGQLLAMEQRVTGLEAQLNEISSRLTQIELRLSGTIPSNPIPQTR